MFRDHLAAKTFFASTFIALALALPSQAAQRQGAGQGTGTRSGASISGVDQAQQIDCGGRPAEVSGSGNNIHFTGDCPGLTVNGVDNRIRITVQPGAPISVSGVQNIVSWSVAGQGKPRVSVTGVDNQVRPLR